jgi:hypothetical protein
MNEDAKLESLAKRLGISAAERLDVEETARKVLAGLRQAPAPRRTWIEAHWLRMAATVVLLVGGSVVVSRLIPGGRPRVEVNSHPPHLVADDLGDLNADELRDVLGQFDEMIGQDSVVSDNSDLRELDAPQLKAVLRSMEG